MISGAAQKIDHSRSTCALSAYPSVSHSMS